MLQARIPSLHTGTIQAALHAWWTRPIAIASLLTIFVVSVLAAAAPLVAPDSPFAQDIPNRFAGPSTTHIFGTDELGRDSFTRVLYGTRASLAIAAAALVLGTLPGALLGVVSGYVGGRVDIAVQTFADALLTVPALVIGLIIVAVLGPSLMNIVVAISVIFVPVSYRVVRAAALQVKVSPYIEAAEAIGCPPLRIVTRHIFPNCFPAYTVIASALVVDAIVIEAALSFLGFGIPPPHPSLGQALKRAMPFMETSPWLVIFPGAAIGLIVLSTSLLADELRDLLDPRLHR